MSSELVGRLRERAESYRMGGPSSEHTAALLDEAAARIEALEAENAELRKKLNGCQWYWPEDDTSEDCCGESAQEIVQNAYDWSSKNAGRIVAVARGGIVEVMW